MRSYITHQIKEAQGVLSIIGVVCIGRTGNRGGPMQQLCDFLLEVPSSETTKIQEGHLVLGLIMCGLVKSAMFKVAD